MTISKLAVKSSKRTELIDITARVQALISEKGIRQGLCVVYCPHTTAAVTINEGADTSVRQDIINKLNELIPENGSYLHAEGNSDAHIKSSLLGCSVVVPISNGQLLLGTWQAVYFCEFDGPRNREVIVKLIRDD